MTQEEKLSKAVKLADAMYYAAQQLTTDASHLKKAMEDWWQFKNVELCESENEKIRKEIIAHCRNTRCVTEEGAERIAKWIAWLEKQGEQKPTQETEPFEAEHGKYYYCIKDYFCGGRKQASKGDVVQALRGLPIMGLKDASEYFLPVSFIKCNSAWSEEDKRILKGIIGFISHSQHYGVSNSEMLNWLKSIKERIGG